jgi:hypothetical protein
MDARRYEISLRVFNSISRYKAEHEKRNSISTSNHVLFCLLYKHTNNDVFDDFPKISEDLRKLSEGHTNVSEHFRRLPKTSDEDPKMFWSNTNKFSTVKASNMISIIMSTISSEWNYRDFRRSITAFLRAENLCKTPQFIQQNYLMPSDMGFQHRSIKAQLKQRATYSYEPPLIELRKNRSISVSTKVTRYANASETKKPNIMRKYIDPFHKWLPIINSFVSIKISLTNLAFELIIQKNFYSQTRLVRLI